MSNLLDTIRQELKVPKSEYNSFGSYSYRTKEKILEAVKPLLYKYAGVLQFRDELIEINGTIFLKCVAILTKPRTDGDGEYFSSVGYARHADELKGMQPAQVTGATTSYAQKSALDAMFLLDSGGDLDARKPEVSLPKTTTPKSTVGGKVLPYLNEGTAEFTKAVAEVKSGTSTLDSLKKTYRLSKAVEAKLAA